MQNIKEIEKAIEELIDKIDNMMLRMRNGYLEHERSDNGKT